MGTMAAQYASLAGASLLFLKAGKDMVDLIKKSEGVVASFKQLNDPHLLDDLRKATKGTISDLQLMTLVMQAKNFQIPLDKFAGSMAYLHGIARQTGKEVKELANMLLLMLGRQSTMRLDEVGIGLIEFNKKLKETGNFADAAFSVMADKLEVMPDNISELSDQFDIASVAIDNFQLKIISSFGSLFMAAEKAHNIMDKFNTMLGLGEKIIKDFDWRLGPAGLTKTTIDYFTSLREGVADTAPAIESFRKAREEVEKQAQPLNKAREAYQKWVEELEKANEKKALELGYMQQYIEESIGVVEAVYAQADAFEFLFDNIPKWEDSIGPIKKVAEAIDHFKPKLSAAAIAAQEVGDQLISTFDYVFTETLIQEQAFGDAMVAGFRSMLERMIADLLARSVVFGILSLIPGIGGLGSFLDFAVKPALGMQSGISPTVSERGGGGSTTNINMPNVTMINSRSITQLKQALTLHDRRH